MLSVMVCLGSPSVQMSINNATGDSYYPVFTNIQYDCTGGGTRRFPDGYLVKTSQCTLDETWSYIAPMCEGWCDTWKYENQSHIVTTLSSSLAYHHCFSA